MPPEHHILPLSGRGPAALAIGSVDGNVLRFMGENLAMPPGRIRRAVVSRAFDHARCYALIDGTLQVARLAASSSTRTPT